MPEIPAKIQHHVIDFLSIDRSIMGKYLMMAGVALTFIYTLIAIATPSDISRIPKVLLAILFLFAVYKSQFYKMFDIGFTLFIASLVLPTVFFLLNHLRDPVSASEYQNLEKLTKMFLFLPVAWWLGGRLSRIFTFLWVSFFGLIIAVLLDPNLSQSLLAMANGYRVDFGIRNTQHTSMFFGISLIGLLVFSHRFLTGGKTSTKSIKWITWITLVLITATVAILTQTRAVWIGLLFCLFIFTLIALVNLVKNGFYKKHFFALVAIGLSAIVLLSVFQETISTRFNTENLTIKELLAGDIQNLRLDSVGIRIHSWVTGIEWIKQRPLIGWGGEVNKHVFAKAADSVLHNREGLGHFHNSYIDIALAYGLLGLSIIAYLFIWSNYRAWQLYKKNALPKDILIFTFLGTCFMAIINLFESYLFMGSGIHVLAIILAPFYSLNLKYCFQPRKIT